MHGMLHHRRTSVVGTVGGFEHRRASRLLADTGGSYHLVAPASYTLIAKKTCIIGGESSCAWSFNEQMCQICQTIQT
jgi:hypothetical protein